MQKLFCLILLVVLFGCSTHSNHESSESVNGPKKTPREYQIGAYLWQQTSGEYRALTYQAYNIAKERVQRDLEDKHNRKRAVVFDIDETVLDNSVGGARDIKRATPWSDTDFSEWVKVKQAVAIPGALDFVKFLVDNRVEVFYISNRAESMFSDTYDNLVAQGFPVKKENLMLMKERISSKEDRRNKILEKYSIILLVGDNLTDFDKAFDKQSVEARNALTDKMRNDFGQKFIILPNPLYGDWERALPKKPRIENLRVE